MTKGAKRSRKENSTSQKKNVTFVFPFLFFLFFLFLFKDEFGYPHSFKIFKTSNDLTWIICGKRLNKRRKKKIRGERNCLNFHHFDSRDKKKI